MSSEFEFDADLTHLSESVKQLCAQHAPESAVRSAMTSQTGYDPALWKRLATELGVLGLDVDERFGGAEAGLVVQALAVEALGAALVCGPIFGTLLLGVPLLGAVNDSEVKRQSLQGVVEGETTIACALPSFGAQYASDAVTVSVADSSGEPQLTGVADQVVDGPTADTLIVAANSASGVALYVIPPDATGVQRETLSTVDLTRRQARVTFSSTPATLLAGPEDASRAIHEALQRAAVLLAAEQVGGAQHMLDTTVAYAKQRFQFGRAIGTFQAVKHRCADMLVSVEQARSAMFHAAWALQDGTEDVALAVSLAKAVASETYLTVTANAIQLHGGIGVTWEHSAHLYYKRAITDSLLLGRIDDHYELVGRQTVDVPVVG